MPNQHMSTEISDEANLTKVWRMEMVSIPKTSPTNTRALQPYAADRSADPRFDELLWASGPWFGVGVRNATTCM